MHIFIHILNDISQIFSVFSVSKYFVFVGFESGHSGLSTDKWYPFAFDELPLKNSSAIKKRRTKSFYQGQAFKL